MDVPAPIVTPPVAELYCPACGYDLRAAASERCPECGLTIDGAGPQVPWERRNVIGRANAFVRTVWLATVRPGRLSRVVSGRVHVPSAVRFRRIVLGIVAIAVTAAFVAVVIRAGGPSCMAVLPDPSDTPGMASLARGAAMVWSAGAMSWPVLPLGFALVLWAGTRWDHWFVLPSVSEVQRNRAMAGAFYTVAPVLGCIVLAGVGVVGFESHVLADLTDNWFVGWAAPVWVPMSVLLVASVFVLGPARYAIALPGGGWGRGVVILIGVAVQWCVAVLVGIGLFPAAVGLVWIMVDSLR